MIEPTEDYLRRLLGRVIPLPEGGREVPHVEASRKCAAWIRLAAATLDGTPLTDEIQELVKRADQETREELVSFLKQGGQLALRDFAASIMEHLFRLWLGSEPPMYELSAATNVARAVLDIVQYPGEQHPAFGVLKSYGFDEPAWQPLVQLAHDELLVVDDVERAMGEYFR